MGEQKNNFIYVLWGGGGGGVSNRTSFRGNEDFVDIWGGGSRIGLVLGVISMQFLGPLLSSLYRIQNGDILGVAQISVLFIYLFIFKLKRMRQV